MYHADLNTALRQTHMAVLTPGEVCKTAAAATSQETQETQL